MTATASWRPDEATPARLRERLGRRVPVLVLLPVLALAGCGGDGADGPDLGRGGIVAPGADGSATDAPGTATGAPTTDAPPPVTTEPSTGESFSQRTGLRAIDTEADIDVPDQSGDGTSVQVEEVEVSREAAWVAVFSASDQLLGAAPVTRGARPVSVPLTTPVPATGELRAVLFADDGDGVFDLTTDPVLVDDDDDDGDLDDDLVEDDFDYALTP